MNDPATLTLREAAAAIAHGRLRAEALVEACLDRIERLQPTLNVFIRVSAEETREQARAADAAVKAGRTLGRLHGVPLAHKDIFYRAGEICTCGSKIRADFVPDHTATVLARSRWRAQCASVFRPTGSCSGHSSPSRDPFAKPRASAHPRGG